MTNTAEPTTYSRTLEVFGRVWTYEVRPVTLSAVPMFGVYNADSGILHAAFIVDEHARRYVDQMAGGQ